MLLVRPRGWHLQERHVEVDGKHVSAGLFDFGVYLQRNAERLLERGSGPYFYLPKLESHLEARLWNDVFCFAQDHLGIPRGTIKATVLIETILAAFEMDEILYELRDHSAGLNAGSLGLHLLGHQEVPRSSRVRAPGSRAGDDDRPVHARIHRAPRADVPLARGARDRRHGRVHPEPARSRGQRERAGPRPRGQGARVGRRLRRHLGCAPRSRPGGEGRVRRRARRSAEPARTPARGRDDRGVQTS